MKHKNTTKVNTKDDEIVKNSGDNVEELLAG